jgi:hypothetical protein
MESIILLAEARALGLQVRVDGEHLIVRGSKRLAALAEQLLSHKEEVRTILEAFEERAGIMEYCGGLAREDAERLAWQCVLGDKTLACNPVPSSREPDEILPGDWKAEANDMLKRDPSTWTETERQEMKWFEDNDPRSRWVRSTWVDHLQPGDGGPTSVTGKIGI